ncbi:pentapeptide repeat-containing protein [Fischerella sp. PCC 9605]|uniref:pentapeptide repeat-containing protein n=1 Tax=Fischerella sp. PCC 9605 TaxID=1173024 RepID=UPI00068635B7|nr:pentapeptide repeat-containing protein [Fischerella sp. PCC 9605]
MANEEHLAILKQGVEVWNEWRRCQENNALNILIVSPANIPLREVIWGNEFQKLIEVNLTEANLQGADLRGAMLGSYRHLMHLLKERGLGSGDILELRNSMVHLEKADLSNADLRGTDLHRAKLNGANLNKADLSGADLSGAILDGAELVGAKFNDADLSKASLRNAKLIGLPAWVVQSPEFIEKHGKSVGFFKAHLSGAKLDEVDLSGARLNGLDLQGVDFSKAKSLSKVEFVKADLSRANLRKVDLREANLRGANLIEADLSGAKLNKVDLSRANRSKILGSIFSLAGESLNAADIREANLRGAILKGVNLSWMDLTGINLSEADLSGAKLIRTQALNTNFYKAVLTGACIEDWHTNSTTSLDGVICDYIYLRDNQQERRPGSGNFAPGEFTKLFQKSLETLDLIFRNGIDWDAFAYSFKKVEVENQGAQLDVQSIEKKGDGILVVRVAVSPDADKAKIHGDFMQGYEFAHKVLEAQYQARLEDKDKVINQLFSTINQQNKQLAETSGKVTIYYQPDSQFAGGIVDANTVNAEQIGGNIQNTDN